MKLPHAVAYRKILHDDSVNPRDLLLNHYQIIQFKPLYAISGVTDLRERLLNLLHDLWSESDRTCLNRPHKHVQTKSYKDAHSSLSVVNLLN